MPEAPPDRPTSPPQWVTRIVHGEPRDVRLDPATGQPKAVATWVPPLRLLKPDRCTNCAGKRQRPSGPVTAVGDGIRDPSPVCEHCGLTALEDQNLHEDIRARLGCTSYIEAAERALSRGQKVLALKMASAEQIFGPDRYRARRARLRLLADLERPDLVVEEAQLWLREKAAAPEVAVVVAESLLRVHRPTEAWAALDESLRLRPNHAELRLVRARMLRLAGRQDDALEDVLTVLRPEHPESLAGALRQLEKLCEKALAEQDPGWVVRAVDGAAQHTHRHAPACALRAQAEEALGQLSGARRWWTRTLHLDAAFPGAEEHLRRLDAAMGLATVPEY